LVICSTLSRKIWHFSVSNFCNFECVSTISLFVLFRACRTLSNCVDTALDDCSRKYFFS